MIDIRFSTLSDIGTLEATDIIPVTDATDSQDKRTSPAEIKTYVLGSGIDVGGTGAGDIATIDGTQTLTNKTLTAPKINENVAVTATATEINKLASCTATTANLNLTNTYASQIAYLSGLTGNAQNQINAITAVIPGLTGNTYCYYSSFLASGTTKDISEATILASSMIDKSGYEIDPKSIIAQVSCSSTANVYYAVGNAAPWPYCTWTTSSTGGQRHLNTLTINSLTSGAYYTLTMTFKIQNPV